MEPTEADPGLPPALETGPDGEAASTGPEQALGEGLAEPIGEGAGSLSGGAMEIFGQAAEFLDKGGIAIWAITALSILTLAIILWKLWRYSRSGVWRRARAEAAVDCWRAYRDDEALEIAMSGRGVRARLATVAIRCADAGWTEDEAREETVRVAKGLLAEARAGLRPLELIATVAPLLGLLGTVLGMITAFQQLQFAGARADPSALAGGIWEALLTTAAGMAVAIPASTALTWFESVSDRLRHDLEDIATRVFARPKRMRCSMPRSEIAFGESPRRRGPSLTPMIDVVFLLLVFFMLAARFGLDNAIPLSPALAGGGTWEGAPRLVEVAPGAVRLNGAALDLEALAPELRALMPDEAAPVVLRPVEHATLQEVVGVLDRLAAAGIRNLVLAE